MWTIAVFYRGKWVVVADEILLIYDTRPILFLTVIGIERYKLKTRHTQSKIYTVFPRPADQKFPYGNFRGKNRTRVLGATIRT